MRKLWRDDIRRPPDGSWFWACTNQEAQDFLERAKHKGKPIEICSLDLDVLDVDIQEGKDIENDGFVLLRWMVEKDLIPSLVAIHSWNHVEAESVVKYLYNVLEHGEISNENLTITIKRFLR